MARIRTIKPEFWADEKLSLLDPVTRLVFLGLISMADDAGRLIDNVKLLDGQLFPSTDDTCRDALDILARTSRITRYRSSSGQPLIQISNWERHQKVDHPNKYVLPGPETAAIVQVFEESGDSGHSRNTRENVATPSRDVRDTTPDLRPSTSTNDHRSTTPDRRGGFDEMVASLSEQWKRARGGTPPTGKIAELAPLHDEHGPVVLQAAFARFLSSEKAQYGIPFFAQNFGDYLTDRQRSPPNGKQSHADKVRASRDALLRGTG